jgi:glycosyltransferase involved in cell wall biosynthesis
VRILLVVHQFFPEQTAGTELLTLAMAQGLRVLGHEVKVLTGAAESNSPENCHPWMTEDVHADFKVHRLHYGTSQRRNPVSIHWEEINRVAAVCNQVSEFRTDVVHFTHVIGLSAAAIPAVRKMGVPVFFNATDYWMVCPRTTLYRTYDQSVCEGPADGIPCVRCFRPMPNWVAHLAMMTAHLPLIRWLSKLKSVVALRQRPSAMTSAVNTATRIFTSTRFLAEVLIRNGVETERIRVIPYGVDIGPLPERIHIPEEFTLSEPLRLGFIGTISAIKGPHVLVEALHLLKEHKARVSLDIYGRMDPDDQYCQRLRQQVEASRLPVHFRGIFPHSNIGSILRSLHIVGIPSIWYESAPLILCDSLAAGTPVLVSRLGGLTEGIEEGVNGLSFPAGNADALNRLIRGILEDPFSLRRMRESWQVKIPSVAEYVRQMETEYLMELKSNG